MEKEQMEKERTPATFWLKDKQVAGVEVAEHGGKELVSYNKRYYVVNGKTPDRRHYTESSLPALWRLVIAGESPPSPTPSKARKGPSRKPAVEAGQQPAEQQGVAPAAERQKKLPALSGRTPEAPPKGSKKRTRAKVEKGDRKQQVVRYSCPYCNAQHACGVEKAGAPFFEKCSNPSPLQTGSQCVEVLLCGTTP